MSTKKIQIDIKIGDMVEYKAEGKVARCERTAGMLVRGIVTAIGDDIVTVLPNYRTEEGAMFPNMKASVPANRIKTASIVGSTRIH